MLPRFFKIGAFIALLSFSEGQVDLFKRDVKKECDDTRTHFLSSSDRIMRNWKVPEVKEKVFEADIILTDKQKERWKVSGYLDDNGPLIQEKWPSKTITYKLGSPAPNKALVKDAMNEWSSKTCIKFVEGTSNALTIIKGKGCYAPLGNSEKKEMSVSDLCDKGSVVHLLGHVIGLAHPHSRPDRDKHLSIQFQNTALQDVLYMNFNDYDKCPYDYASVMHFDMFGLSYNGESVFLGNSKVMDGIMLSSAIGSDWSKPSDSDAALVNREYGCPEKPCGKGSVTQPKCNKELTATSLGAEKMVSFRDIMSDSKHLSKCVWKSAVATSLKCSRAAIAVSLSEKPAENLKRAWFASGCRLFQVEIYDLGADMIYFYCAGQFARKPTKAFVSSGSTIYAFAKLYPSTWQNFLSSAMKGYVKMFNIKDYICLGEINAKCS